MRGQGYFLITNKATGTPEKESNVVVVLRHSAIPYAFEDRLWDKYKFGDMFKVKNDKGETVTKNAFWKPPQGTYNLPGFGVVPIGINELQDSGVKFVVCNAAMTVYSAVYAMQNNAKGEDVKKDWESGLLPGSQLSHQAFGPWAVHRKINVRIVMQAKEIFLIDEMQAFSLHFLFCNQQLNFYQTSVASHSCAATILLNKFIFSSLLPVWE